MNVLNLTIGQKKVLLESLTNQKSPKTSAEIKTLAALREDLAEVIVVGERKNQFIRIGNLIRMIDMDNFGEDYRNRWVKIYENSKGEFFNMSYLGNKRIFI